MLRTVDPVVADTARRVWGDAALGAAAGAVPGNDSASEQTGMGAPAYCKRAPHNIALRSAKQGTLGRYPPEQSIINMWLLRNG